MSVEWLLDSEKTDLLTLYLMDFERSRVGEKFLCIKPRKCLHYQIQNELGGGKANC